VSGVLGESTEDTARRYEHGRHTQERGITIGRYLVRENQFIVFKYFKKSSYYMGLKIATILN
jgi:hypothetical protein